MATADVTFAQELAEIGPRGTAGLIAAAAEAAAALRASLAADKQAVSFIRDETHETQRVDVR